MTDDELEWKLWAEADMRAPVQFMELCPDCGGWILACSGCHDAGCNYASHRRVCPALLPDEP